MNREKVKEIKKALEFCASLKKRCRDCDYNEIGCYKLLKDSLTLINELESDNKSLQDLCNKTYEDLTKEIDRLENRVKELEEGIYEEMAKAICNTCKTRVSEQQCNSDKRAVYGWCSTCEIAAKELINLGYQKVDKDKQVVLTKEEYDNLKLEIQKAHNKGVRAGFDLTKYKENSIEQARKETAEKIFEGLMQSKQCQSIIDVFEDNWFVSNIDIKRIAKQYGVEVDND